ncbi:phosphonate C-P lyase system protein PhnH [Hansschlegelia quercus]|uniref:Phosphonate C-P lyase system protein PhnH n=1 Tax=Hansschlegelia quercus TaxID=2528245 RepID=A0A4Q9GFY8_9HYPH|nr:phosphonate C-P lyase system protein PhnH [Hansschlegelia quercus]TBN51891.1 phosphonate C-P lyase system protein PhnH [Hansschlegelia quercus]
MTLAAGFDDAVSEAQSCFRAVMGALSRPGLVKPLASGIRPPAPLTPELAAIALSLADPDAPLWLDRRLSASSDVRDFLRFHTGARIVEQSDDAAFALVVDPASMPDLSEFAQGSDAYPDRSTTIVVAAETLTEGGPLVLKGPGVDGEARLAVAPLPTAFVAQLADNRAGFPRGVDLLIVAEERIAALPRSTEVEEAA